MDKIVRATAFDGNVRIFAANTTTLVEKARKLHSAYPTATAALGRVLTGALLIGAGLKQKETVTIRVEGDGPLGVIMAVADNEGNVKGYVSQPDIYIPPDETGKMPVGRAVGQGMLHVIKDLKLKGVYTGSTPLVSGEIGDDLSSYYYTSEQVPTAFALGVLVDRDRSVKAAGGYMVQLLPGIPEEVVIGLEKKIKELGSISSFIEEGKESLDVVKYLASELELTIYDEIEAAYTCNCCRMRIEKILLALGEKEILDMIEEQGQAELSCHFCNKKYHLSKEELHQLIKDAKTTDE